MASDTAMVAADIASRIPHRPPMLLIDEIVRSDSARIVCRKTFHEHEFFVQGHFPDQAIVPGVIQCECCLQAGALLITADSDDAQTNLPVVTRMDKVKFKRVIQPGESAEIEVTLNERLGNAFFMSGKLSVDGKLATRLDFACSLTTFESKGS